MHSWVTDRFLPSLQFDLAEISCDQWQMIFLYVENIKSTGNLSKFCYVG